MSAYEDMIHEEYQAIEELDKAIAREVINCGEYTDTKLRDALVSERTASEYTRWRKAQEAVAKAQADIAERNVVSHELLSKCQEKVVSYYGGGVLS